MLLLTHMLVTFEYYSTQPGVRIISSPFVYIFTFFPFFRFKQTQSFCGFRCLFRIFKRYYFVTTVRAYKTSDWQCSFWITQ